MIPDSFSKKKDSILFLGRDTAGEELWCSTSMVKTHMFVSGSTGSGKTEFLINVMANVAAWGSGGVFIDGKGDIALFSKLHAVMTAAGREEDLLLVNFSPVDFPEEGKMNSHTINPFAILKAEELNLILSGMLSTASEHEMWTGRAISLMNAVVNALVWLRDERKEPLTISKIRSHLALNELLHLRKRLRKDRETPWHVLKEIDFYFDTLPGFNWEKGEKQGQQTLEQHGYLSMQWTRPIGMLASGYGHIFDTETPDVDIRDVVLNRRILVILLPSLDRSSDDIRNIGSLFVGMLKSMLGQALRSSVEGTWGEVVRKRITNATYPFLMIMDEVGQYITDGMGMMAQQARSLNVGLVFATQDFDSLYHSGPREVEAILANTNVKVFMKAENPGATQINNVLSTFIESRRFEKQKFQSILDARRAGVTDRLNHGFGTRAKREVLADQLFATNETKLKHFETDKPSDLALMLRGFSAGDMMATHGMDVVIGRAGFVELNHEVGQEHEISLQRFYHLSQYGQEEVDANTVLKHLRQGIETIVNSKGGGDEHKYNAVTSPTFAAFDLRVVDEENITTVWSELLFHHLKSCFPDDLKSTQCAYLERVAEVNKKLNTHPETAANQAPSVPRKSDRSEVDVLKLFWRKA